MARTETTAALLLRSVDYGDADRIVTLLTELHGKVALMARGARRSKKRFVGSLEPYALIEAEMALGRGEIGRLAQARVVRAFPGLLGNLVKIGFAAAALEILRETVGEHDAPDPRTLPTAVRFLELLETVEAEGIDSLHLGFVLRVLALTGHSPNLEHCGRCGRPAPENKAALFAPKEGSVVCRACGGAPHKLPGPLRMAMLRASTRAWDRPDEARTVEGLQLIQEFLEWHLGKPLTSSEMITQVRAVSRDRSDG